jgi:hypothetical protein
MKLKSFGCSFMAGTDLVSPTNTWPARVADRLGIEYECHARPGIGNLQIMESILDQCEQEDTVFVINWTWIDRFDFVDISTESWNTLRPSLDHKHAYVYYRNLHSQYRDMLTNLCYIHTAIEYLILQNQLFIMTYMDYLLFEAVDKNWHRSRAVQMLQNKIRQYLTDWQDKNFLDWSRDLGYQISLAWHPLDSAHQAAADFMMPRIDAILRRA